MLTSRPFICLVISGLGKVPIHKKNNDAPHDANDWAVIQYAVNSLSTSCYPRIVNTKADGIQSFDLVL